MPPAGGSGRAEPSRYALAILALLSAPAHAQGLGGDGTGSDWGGVGLIEMRNARFRADGVVEAGAALRNQRRFWFVGFQALPWLETTFRVSERLNGTTGSGIVTDRSFDLKIRLWDEQEWRPALAVGIQDIAGTGIYAGEYLVASKRFWDFDVTLGMGWGRLGTYADGNNPLTRHLERLRRADRATWGRAARCAGSPISAARTSRSSAASSGTCRRCPRRGATWRGCARRSSSAATGCATNAAGIPGAPRTCAAIPPAG